jgi:hypothetical protein
MGTWHVTETNGTVTAVEASTAVEAARTVVGERVADVLAIRQYRPIWQGGTLRLDGPFSYLPDGTLGVGLK